MVCLLVAELVGVFVLLSISLIVYLRALSWYLFSCEPLSTYAYVQACSKPPGEGYDSGAPCVLLRKAAFFFFCAPFRNLDASYRDGQINLQNKNMFES
uniref:Putative secreted protein n=1 Tax=Ixodes ricinus TaxID=34613 RepID=A0A6B0UG29_IXORI